MKIEETLTIMTDKADISLTVKEVKYLYSFFKQWLDDRGIEKPFPPVRLSDKHITDEKNKQLFNFLR
jgi:hypothetical protein